MCSQTKTGTTSFFAAGGAHQPLPDLTRKTFCLQSAPPPTVGSEHQVYASHIRPFIRAYLQGVAPHRKRRCRRVERESRRSALVSPRALCERCSRLSGFTPRLGRILPHAGVRYPWRRQHLRVSPKSQLVPRGCDPMWALRRRISLELCCSNVCFLRLPGLNRCAGLRDSACDISLDYIVDRRTTQKLAAGTQLARRVGSCQRGPYHQGDPDYRATRPISATPR